jgi:hypothetical protein
MHISSIGTIGLALLQLAYAHCKITYVAGDLGGAEVALGLSHDNLSSTSDVTLFTDPSLPFGMTLGGVPITLQDELPKAMTLSRSSTLPQIQGGSTVSMMLYQIDNDGAGPMRCLLDASGTGEDFKPIEVTIDVPGVAGLSSTKDQEWPLEAAIPTGVECQGSIAELSRLCFVKCANPRGYGGVVVVQQSLERKSKLELRSDGRARKAGKERKQGNRAKTRDVVETDARARIEGKQGNKMVRGMDIVSPQMKTDVRPEGRPGDRLIPALGKVSARNEEDVRPQGKPGNKKSRDVTGSTEGRAVEIRKSMRLGRYWL